MVETLAVDLEALGFTVWFDRELAGGQEWWEEILHSIRRSHLFLYALTPESIESYPCKLEYDYAMALNKRILPVMLADVNISLLPSSVQRFQIVDYRLQDKQQALALGRAMNSLPKTRPLPKPLPTKPEAPVPPLTRLRDQIDSPSLGKDEQELIVARLKEFLENSATANDARNLLTRLCTRDDLLAKTEKEINRLLGVKKIVEAQTHRSLFKAAPQVFSGHTEAVFGVAYAPDGKTILTAGVDKIALLWDIATGQVVSRLIGHTNTIWNIAYSPDSRVAATSSRDRTVRLWNLTTGEEIHQLVGHTESVWGVAYAPDGQTIVTGSFDKTARLWNANTGKEIRQFTGHSAAVWGVAYAPDGHTVLTGSWDRTVCLWDGETG
ncbi:MAG: TIR domain-containing protein, partial [Chloroflexi bacterium]|nr:TIR domain-containing protein [Chloroflexota bacterium]